MLRERTPGEVAYDNAVVGELRKGLSIKKALKLAGEKYPNETLHVNDQTVHDIKVHYEYLRNYQDILAKMKHMSKRK